MEMLDLGLSAAPVDPTPLPEAAPEAVLESVPAPVSAEAQLAAVREWIAACLDTAPPASQLHFSLHLASRYEDLAECFRALA